MWWVALRTRPEAAPAAAACELGTEALDTALAWRCLQWTPRVAWVDGVLVMELSGSARLFGGPAALLRSIHMQNRALARMEYAQGATALVAVGRLLAASPLRQPVPMEALPLQSLEAARAHAGVLARMGVRTWGQLRALPRAGVARRFGQALLDALDRAWGDQPDACDWLQLPPAFSRRIELAASVDSAPGLLFGARRLLALLLEWLRARQQGVLALALEWELDARRANARHHDAHHLGGDHGRLELRTARPTQDMAHLQRLLAEHLARVQLPAPVLYLQLHSLQTAALGGESHDLLLQGQRAGDDWSATVERLAARLGPKRVRGARLHDDHRPEHMQRWVPLQELLPVAMKKRAARAINTRAEGPFGLQSGPVDGARGADPALLPPTLLEPPCPVPLDQLRLLGAVQRLECGWWEGAPLLRDYQWAWHPVLGLVWVFCERLRRAEAAQHWFVQGVWG